MTRIGILLVGMGCAAAACSSEQSGVPGSGAANPAGGHEAGAAGGAAGAGATPLGGHGGMGTAGAGAQAGAAGQGGVPAWQVPCEAGGESGTCLEAFQCTGQDAPVPGHCGGPEQVQCCVDTNGVCNPDAAPQPNVGLEEAPGVGGCPPGMIPVDTFCVDRYEASLVYAASGIPFSPYVNPGDTLVRAVSIEGAVPQGYIDGVQAAAACEAAAKQLCTDEQWLRACQGPAGTTFPYGDTREPGVCNDARAVHPAVEYFGTTDSWIWSELGNACLDQLPASLARTGSHPGCVTAEGAFDMMGNLHEWTADPNGTFRGGYYVDTVINGPGCLYATTAHNTLHWDYSTGFRCCAI